MITPGRSRGPGGTGSAGGENQESSSEAVQGWGGVFLLGAALNDDPMTAAGAMGDAMETSAARDLLEIGGKFHPADLSAVLLGQVGDALLAA